MSKATANSQDAGSNPARVSDDDVIRFMAKWVGWRYADMIIWRHWSVKGGGSASINDLAEAVRVKFMAEHEPLQRIDMAHLPHCLFQKGPIPFLRAVTEVVKHTRDARDVEWGDDEVVDYER